MQSFFIKLPLIILTVLGLFGSNEAFAEQAPNFKFDHSEQAAELNDHRGQVIYLDFWASWCQPCRKSFDWMNEMQAKYGDEGLTIIAVNLDDSKDKANAFLKQLPADFKLAFDPEGDVAKAYDIKAMPSSFIIDQNGHVIHANLGFHRKDEKQLEATILKSIRQSVVASR